MRKIRKFSVNESMSVLSADEMRRINGGKWPCNSAGCIVYIEYVDGTKGTYEGDCVLDKDDEGYYVCSCKIDSGTYGANGVCD